MNKELLKPIEEEIGDILIAYEYGNITREQALARFDALRFSDQRGSTDKWYATEHRKNFERYNPK